ncbi:uncharacterized protein BDZ99DRAFT_154940 [Mytilinidion resinicola]|uniref:HMG box domain-containing protein n=1 Tax=Mytilinidion resinicola TaxID=574789 RepID=A0A6A6Y712_9PEZI|nr:uncharacterized protein BDZ99DRAFT_154940 [Mytilinidion resinicola]KAF2804318.1 hypothetical protein BDZ99DRAFT_154940 [Mytilinidion resinicola]
MNDLGERLERLGLSQYLDAFVTEGFDTWETILDITESDLGALNVKLGHRRKLQRAIAETRGQYHDRPTIATAASVDGSYRSDESGSEHKAKKGAASATAAGGGSTKRKYRRHPKPDEHAPERPPSAYVIFSNQMREMLKGQELSFTEIAKVVGERWQVLSPDAREACESQANGAKEKYYTELAEYKKTPQYDAYQKYLEEFKAKHAAPVKEGKRSKLETETSISTTRSSSNDVPERAPNRRLSSGLLDGYPLGHQRSGSSPPTGPQRPPMPQYPTKSASPATYSLSGYNSPRLADHYSSVSASPRSANLQKETSFDYYPGGSSFVPESTQPHAPSYSHTYASNTSPSQPSSYTNQLYNAVELPSRRPYREMSTVPGLSHEDTTLSSASGVSISPGSQYGGPPGQFPGLMLPSADPPKSQRVLPPPVHNPSVQPSPLDVRPPPQGAQSSEYRNTSSLAALLRAGELARSADIEQPPVTKADFQ